ncbi:malate permease [Secundilactobacillus pentosiphilus]|uniref:Malate permease n=1 Tax=Secundilactobacillus pentosiphilus TaxID=1714682 RepID=A0A1Z5IRH2_9LACO|nr:AEC family transporter [Secundilactobacillus pentosiphilus]GAX04364.1 malate permease [Secundilactobacillus pentosiphilus]
MTIVRIIFGQTAIMFLIMLVGFLCFRVGLVDESGSQQISNIVIYISNPALLLNSFIGNLKVSQMIDGLYALIILTVMMLATIAVAKLIFRKPEQMLIRFALIFANLGFIGLPLSKAVLGTGSIFYMSIFVGVSNFSLWTYGIYMVSGDRRTIQLKRLAVNPAILALIFGLLFALTGVKLPSVLGTAVSDLADMNLPLVMIAMGCYLAQGDVRSALKSKALYQAVGARLIIAPLIVLAILQFIPNQFMMVKEVILLGQATPVAALMAIFSNTFHKNSLFSTTVVGLTTLCSLVTIPLFMGLAQWLWHL